MYKFDFVINLAAQAGVRYSIENPETYVDSNLVGFANIIECCRNYNIRHLVYASSSSVYGENAKVPFNTEDRADYPVSLYAATKRCNELMAYTYSHLYGIRTTGLRFFTVYGPWGRPDMAPMLFANAISNNERIRIFNNGNMSRDFTYIDDIIKGIEIVIGYHAANSNHHPGFRIFNIGNGHPEKLLDFVETLESSLGIVGDKELIAMQPGDVTKTWADIIEMEKLGYRSTTSINDGIGKFVNWYSNYYNKEK